MADWLVPIRRANSACDEPARRRARANSTEISDSGASASYSALTSELVNRRALSFSNETAMRFPLLGVARVRFPSGPAIAADKIGRSGGPFFDFLDFPPSLTNVPAKSRRR